MTKSADKKRADFEFRWTSLRSSRRQYDRQLAELAADIRDCFPNDASGTKQFHSWLVNNLTGMGVAQAKKIGRMAEAWFAMSDEEWDSFQDWRAISNWLGYSVKARHRILADLKSRSDRAGPITQEAVRHAARRMKLTRKTKHRGGAPNYDKLCRDVTTLRRFVAELVENQGLELPDEVKKAMTDDATKLVKSANARKREVA